MDVPIVGNVQDVLGDMIKLLEAEQSTTDISEWWKEIEGWRATQCLKYRMGDEIMPQYVIEKLWELTGGDAIVTTDVGQHQMWAAQYYKFDKPRRWLTSGGLGTMGVGLPYAMGAALANPDKQVACITGDGSIQMCIQELSTSGQAVRSADSRDHQPEQPLPGHGPPVAGNVLQPSLFADLHGLATGLRQAGRGPMGMSYPRG